MKHPVKQIHQDRKYINQWLPKEEEIRTKWGVTADGYRVSFGDENFLKLS